MYSSSASSSSVRAARQHLAEYAQRSANPARRDYWYHEIIRADEQAGPQRTDRTHYLAAKAQLELAQPARDVLDPLQQPRVAPKEVLTNISAVARLQQRLQIEQLRGQYNLKKI